MGYSPRGHKELDVTERLHIHTHSLWKEMTLQQMEDPGNSSFGANGLGFSSKLKDPHPYHTVHGVLKARILKWFAIPFSCGPQDVSILHSLLPRLFSGKESPWQCRKCRRPGSNPWCNSMDTGAWQATVRGVTKIWTRLHLMGGVVRSGASTACRAGWWGGAWVFC